ncbi:hypothetical protein F4809DRAFT_523665 [Biscogniauxia mediterranea]|nr:hypothetical protein F4809DRAFT_523665 [Biscogniauxia mediterranea]
MSITSSSSLAGLEYFAWFLFLFSFLLCFPLNNGFSSPFSFFFSLYYYFPLLLLHLLLLYLSFFFFRFLLYLAMKSIMSFFFSHLPRSQQHEKIKMCWVERWGFRPRKDSKTNLTISLVQWRGYGGLLERDDIYIKKTSRCARLPPPPFGNFSFFSFLFF